MKPKLFIASSTEGTDIAGAIHAQLQTVSEVTPWDHGFFELSKHTLTNLLEKIAGMDFAVAVLTPDDVVRIRDGQYRSARDNVILELGVLLGHLGPHRTFVVVPQSRRDFRLPSDLDGFLYGTYEDSRQDDNWQAAVGPFCSEVRQQIRQTMKTAEAEENERFDAEFVTVIERTSQEETSREFYDHFNELLRNCQHSVVLVGSGFHCADESSTRRAENYLRVLTGCALRLRDRLVRIELGDPSLQKWGDRLSRYLAPMEKVDVLVPTGDSRDATLLKDVCLMDPGTDRAVVEMMFPVPTLTNTADSEVEVVGQGMFLRSRKVADTFKRLIYDMRRKNIFKLVDVEGLRQHFDLPPIEYDDGEGYGYYFAYGSNMLERQMQDRTRRAELIGPARIEGFRLAFNIPGTIFPNAVANLIEENNAETWGALYRVQKAEFIDRMDFYEGVHHGEYTRETARVFTSSGEAVDAFIYRNPGVAQEAAPSLGYLDIMLRGAKAVGLPKSYIEELKARKAEVKDPATNA